MNIRELCLSCKHYYADIISPHLLPNDFGCEVDNDKMFNTEGCEDYEERARQ